MDYSEKWGTSVEEAVKLALIDLKLTKEEVEVIVLEEPTKGFFGIGSKLAKVRVEKKKEETKVQKIKETVKVKETPVIEVSEKKKENTIKKEEISEKPAKKPETYLRENIREGIEKEPEKKTALFFEKETKMALRERPLDLTEIKESPALTFLEEVTKKMGLSLTMCAFENEENLYIDIEGKDSGTIIGKRGQTLDAIQYLTSIVMNKDRQKYIRVVVDAENYREKREKTLEQLANRLAEKVKRSGKSVRLEPMNPYERKVIHSTLQGRPGITTRSEGEEPYRRVIIEQK